MAGMHPGGTSKAVQGSSFSALGMKLAHLQDSATKFLGDLEELRVLTMAAGIEARAERRSRHNFYVVIVPRPAWWCDAAGGCGASRVDAKAPVGCIGIFDDFEHYANQIVAGEDYPFPAESGIPLRKDEMSISAGFDHIQDALEYWYRNYSTQPPPMWLGSQDSQLHFSGMHPLRLLSPAACSQSAPQ